MATIVFDYLVPRTGNGIQTSIPNLKDDQLILQRIDFNFTDEEVKPEVEVTIDLKKDKLKYARSYFQIFDSINLNEHWATVTSGDNLELFIKNLSNKDHTCQVTYHYVPSDGIILHSSHSCAREINEKSNSLMRDLFQKQIISKIYLKSETNLGQLRLVPKFRFSTEAISESNSLTPATFELDLSDEKEVCLDFTDKDLLELRPMLAFYRLEINASDLDKNIYILAYGFRE